MVWSLDPAAVVLVVRAGFWNPGVSAHSLSGINFGFIHLQLHWGYLWPAVCTCSSFVLGEVFHALALWVPEAVPGKGFPLEQKIGYFVSTEQGKCFFGQVSPFLLGCCQVVHAPHLSFNHCRGFLLVCCLFRWRLFAELINPQTRITFSQWRKAVFAGEQQTQSPLHCWVTAASAEFTCSSKNSLLQVIFPSPPSFAL